ncbi:hypothetical protein EDB81DRAFT_334273 [Dactylonectria macrodidyma]|uniref:Uncharacterized protein n=1 Tax=Dactylonectria macrodidyma TaxID=307937 RepID=A0A9P9FGN3_9HYPO|nr:hypothetical protein EDB81DRAFT_334273 [Dactylonectria macrodidyma]
MEPQFLRLVSEPEDPSRPRAQEARVPHRVARGASVASEGESRHVTLRPQHFTQELRTNWDNLEMCWGLRLFKCDETRPGCTRCAKKHTDAAAMNQRSGQSVAGGQGEMSRQPLGPGCLQANDSRSRNLCDGSWRYGCRSSAACTTLSKATKISLEVLASCCRCHGRCRGSISHLLSGTLAVSASHLRHHTNHASAHEIVERHQKWATIQGFWKALNRWTSSGRMRC